MKKPQPRPHFLPWLLFLLWPVAIRMGGSETAIGSESTAMNLIKEKPHCTKPQQTESFYANRNVPPVTVSAAGSDPRWKALRWTNTDECFSISAVISSCQTEEY